MTKNSEDQNQNKPRGVDDIVNFENVYVPHFSAKTQLGKHFALLSLESKQGKYGMFVLLKCEDIFTGEILFVRTSAAPVLAQLAAIPRDMFPITFKFVAVGENSYRMANVDT